MVGRSQYPVNSMPGAMSGCTCNGGRCARSSSAAAHRRAAPAPRSAERSRCAQAARRKTTSVPGSSAAPPPRRTTGQRQRVDAHQYQALVFMPLEHHPYPAAGDADTPGAAQWANSAWGNWRRPAHSGWPGVRRRSIGCSPGVAVTRLVFQGLYAGQQGGRQP